MKILILCLFVLFAFVSCCYGCAGHVTATGERTGTIIKLSDEGLFIKTHEAEMIKGGMNGGSGSFGVKPFFFTIRNSSDLATVQKAFDNGKEITVSYHDEFMCPLDSESNTCSYLDSIKGN